MTEQQWLTGTYADDMLKLLRAQGSERKVLLFICACCRQKRHLIAQESLQLAVLETEEVADGLRSTASLIGIWWKVSRLPRRGELSNLIHFTRPLQWASNLRDAVRVAGILPTGVRCELLREVLGNPYRPAAVEPFWLNNTVLDIAQAIYAQRAFERMPILADALEDAGCNNPDILEHCRQPAAHVRGCWVLDLLLAKE